MSEEGAGYGYASPQPSSTTGEKGSLPPFSSFTEEAARPEPGGRLLDISHWDWTAQERCELPSAQPQYRPWERKDELGRLPSFQSQFAPFPPEEEVIPAHPHLYPATQPTLLLVAAPPAPIAQRRRRPGSLDSQNESDAASVDGQVAAVSSTAGFRPAVPPRPPPDLDPDPDKPVKKKRKRCGDCIGCQRKDNCGDCAPCRNDKSHQICKMRRCEKLTDKKHLLYMNQEYTRGERGRGRGKGRGNSISRVTTPYRKSNPRSPAPQQNNQLNGSVDNNIMTNIANDHSTRETKLDNSPTIQATTPLPSMTGVMPLYGSPQPDQTAFPQPVQPRFATVWHQPNPDPNTLGAWTPQGQFIQQVPTHQVEDIRYAQYGVAPYPPQPTAVTVGYQSGGFVQNGTYPPGGPSPLHNGGARATPDAEYAFAHDAAAPATPGSAGPPTPTQPGNATPGYPPHPPPPQSSLNSSGYPGQESNISSNGLMGEANHSQPQEMWNGGNGENRQDHRVPTPKEETKDWAGQNQNDQTWTDRPPSAKETPEPSTQDPWRQDQSRAWTSRQDAWTKGAQETWTNQVNSSTSESWTNQESNQNQETTWSSQKNGQTQETWSSQRNGTPQESWSSQENGLTQEPWSNQSNNSTQEGWSNQKNVQNQENNWSNQKNSPKPEAWANQKNSQNQESWSNQQNGSSQETWPGQKNGSSQESWGNQKNGPQESWSNQKNGPQESWSSQKDSPSHEAWSNHKNASSQEGWSNHESSQNQENWSNQDSERSREWSKEQWATRQKNSSPQEQQWQPQDQSWADKKDLERSELNNRLKTMILNKQYQESRRSEEARQSVYQDHAYKTRINSENNFLSLGHHPQVSEGGGVQYSRPNMSAVKQCYQTVKLEKGVEESAKSEMKRPYWETGFSPWSCSSGTEQVKLPGYPQYLYYNSGQAVKVAESKDSYTKLRIRSFPVNQGVQTYQYQKPSQWNKPHVVMSEKVKEGYCHEVATEDLIPPENEKLYGIDMSNKPEHMSTAEFVEYIERLRSNTRTEVPVCGCIDAGEAGEPGNFYSHLGSAASLSELRESTEKRTGLTGSALRIEKIIYTGKEGKTSSGCPLAKWVVRRGGPEEKLLILAKQRPGHVCASSWIVVAVVAWDGVPRARADPLYALLVHKLNKFGVPTARRCATNEPRTCACQGLDSDLCGASFSFGCSWSMYYNGCKFARSKTVRKFRLTVKAEEQEVEDQLQELASDLGPLYRAVAPISFANQTQFEREASACRLGEACPEGRPFSGVTACLDFCAHAHRDLHNMNNGCTVVVSLTKHRSLEKPEEEQLHVLPLYIMDDTDEFGSRDAQIRKAESGALENLTTFPCEVRVRSSPLTPCRRRKRKDEEAKTPEAPQSPASWPQSPSSWPQSPARTPTQLQISQISSTVCDSPTQKWARGTFTNFKSEPEACLSPHRSNYMYQGPTGLAGFKTDPDSSSYQSGYSQAWPVKREYIKQEYLNQEPIHVKQEIKQEPLQWPVKQESLPRFSSIGPSRLAGLAEPQWNGYQNTSLGYNAHPLFHLQDTFGSQPHNNYGYQQAGGTQIPKWAASGANPQPPAQPEPMGNVTGIADNRECFLDSEMGGVAIALGHGSVLFECAKHELHATTAVQRPNRSSPTRISLVFYQHRNLNRPDHGADHWQEKMRKRSAQQQTPSTFHQEMPQAFSPQQPLPPFSQLPPASWTRFPDPPLA